VVSDSSSIRVIIAEEPSGAGHTDCQGSGPTPYTVELGEPIAGRILVDGFCGAPGGTAAQGICDAGGVRWPVP